MSASLKIDKNNIVEICSLTPVQEGMLFHSLEHPDSGAYAVCLGLDIAGNIDQQKCNDAWLAVISKNEILRTVFRWEGITAPVQIVLKDAGFQIEYNNLSNQGLNDESLDLLMPGFNPNAELDLTATPFSVSLYKISEVRFIMAIRHHHILYDGWSTGVLINEFFTAYLNANQYTSSVIAKPSVKEYSVAIINQNNALGLDYWGGYLKDYIHNTNLSLSSFTEADTKQFADYKFILPEKLNNDLTLFSQKQKITIAAILYAAWGLLLQKRLNNNMVLFGTTVSGRNIKMPNIEQAIGLFINTLPLKISTDQDKSLIQLLTEVNSHLMERESFENFPLVEIKRLALGNVSAELFDSIMVIENYPLESDKIKGDSTIKVTGFKAIESTHYNLTVTVSLFEKTEIGFNYNLQSWDQETIPELSDQFVNVLNTIVYHPQTAFGRLNLLTEPQKQQLLKAVENPGIGGQTKNENIIDTFKKNVIADPAAVAIRYNNVELTYWQIHDRARQVASWLLNETNLPAGSRVGFIAERNEHIIPFVFGVLEAGMIYVPISESFSSDTINAIIEDAGIKVLITGRLLPKGLTSSLTIINTEKQLDIVTNYQGLIIPPPVRRDNPAVIIYKVGLQGKVNGTKISHARLSDSMAQIQSVYPLKKEDVVLQRSALDSHLSLEELFGWVIACASLSILPQTADFKTAELIECINNHNVTVVNFTPWLLTRFCNAVSNNSSYAKIQSVRYIFIGDGILHYNQLALFNKTIALNAGAQLIAKYGWAETSGTAAFCKYTSQANSDLSIRIGKAVGNTRLYVLNNDEQLVSAGITGEIAVSGQCVAAGYKDLTLNGQIIEDIYLKGQKLFKTGCLGQLLPDGSIQYLGTAQDVVNIQNLRVNLNLIEQVFFSFDKILECAVVLKHINGSDHIVAYYSAPQKLKQSEIKKFLSTSLPAYVIPGHFVHLYEMPLTKGGKINKAALSEITVNVSDQFTPPANEVEKKLVALWAKVLKIKEETISVKSSFFDLGGHSLRATTLLNSISKEFGVKVSYNTFFKNPTVKSLAGSINETEETSYAAILKAPVQSDYPLSLAQRRLFFLYELNKNETAYNMPFVVKLHRAPDVEKLKQAFQILIDRHEILRTFFKYENEEPRQIVIPEISFDVTYRKLTKEQPQQAIDEFIQPFDLGAAPLFKAGIIESVGGQYFLITDMHHIISDGVSGSIILQELAAIYNHIELPAAKLQYKDYAVWQTSAAYKTHLQQQKSFWIGGFETIPAPLELPADFSRPVVKTYTGNRVELELNKEETKQILTIAEKNNASVFIILLSAYSILLSKLSGQEDIVIGYPVAGRRHADLENMLGMFVNTIPQRIVPAGNLTVKSFISELKERVLASFDNQDYPYEDLINELALERDTSRNPLFDVVFSYENFEETNLELNGNPVSEIGPGRSISKFDLTLSAVKKNDHIKFSFEYADTLFKPETINRYLRYLKRIIAAMYADSEVALSSVQLLNTEESQAIIKSLDNTHIPFPIEETICSLFEKQALNNPDKIAISFNGNHITYQQVLQQSNQVAAALRAQGVRPNTIVALLMDRSVETVIGMLGILKAGGAYLPIDTDYPQDRINYLIEDSGAEVILTAKRLNKVIDSKKNVLDIYTIINSSVATSDLYIVNQPQDACYIIYTSGTTGKPKGVVIEHRNIVRLFFNDAFQFQFGESDVWTMFHSHCFDFSVWEMYGALLFGGKLIIISKPDAIDTRKYLNILSTEKVTVLNQTPSAFYNLIHESLEANTDLSALRYVIFGGEALAPHKLKQWSQNYPQVKLINMFGITETTVHVTYKEIMPADMDAAISNVGTPIPTLSVYLLDKYQNIVPPNVKGEIYVGGEGVARCYLKRETLTAERFIPHPFKPGERIYRSGDVGSLLPDGSIEYLGRADEQVKIRGFRIELGEIESNINSYLPVQEAAAIVREYNGEKYIIAYYIADRPIQNQEFKDHLRAKIPEYMIPAYFIQVEKLQLNQNSKLDKKALPDPVFKVAETLDKPKNQVQKELIKIWSETLGLPEDRVGIQTNFFDIGGNSLKLVKMVNKVNNHFSSNIPVIKAFTYPVISLLADYLETERLGTSINNSTVTDSDVEQMSDTINLFKRIQD